MVNHIGQDFAGILVVFSQLRASIIVRKVDDGVHASLPAPDFFLEPADNLLADAVHAAHRGYHPNLVADAHLAVGAAEALEGISLHKAAGRQEFLHALLEPGQRLGQRRLGEQGLVLVFQKAFQVGFDAAVVHHGAHGDILRYMADGITVLDDVVSGFEAFQHNLVAAGNVHLKHDAFHHFPLHEVLKRYGHIVGRVYLDVLH